MSLCYRLFVILNIHLCFLIWWDCALLRTSSYTGSFGRAFRFVRVLMSKKWSSLSYSITSNVRLLSNTIVQNYLTVSVHSLMSPESRTCIFLSGLCSNLALLQKFCHGSWGTLIHTWSMVPDKVNSVVLHNGNLALCSFTSLFSTFAHWKILL